MKRYASYREQGVFLFPGYDTFLVGNVFQADAATAVYERAKREDLAPIRHQLCYMFDQLTESKAEHSWDYAKHPNVMLNFGMSMMSISDPATVQEVMVNKNAQVDKTGAYAAVLANFFGDSFLFAKTDSKWKAKRKGLGTAFYKDKLIVQMELLKFHLQKFMQNWVEQIRSSETRSINMDLSQTMLNLMQKYLLHVVFGADIDDETKVTVMLQKGTDPAFYPQECNLS